VIVFSCPSCSKLVSAPPGNAGAETVCPHCRRPTRVPNPLAEPTDRRGSLPVPSRVAVALAVVAVVATAVGVLTLAVLWEDLAARQAAAEDLGRPIPRKPVSAPAPKGPAGAE
jgi:hypothetical protein